MILSVFTPAYNRAGLLRRVYQSIAGQDRTDLEWIVVDDGSTDDTAEVMGKLQGGSSFPVIYLKKQNGGKHTAFNMALDHARGEYFLCVDSDDRLSDHAVSVIAEELPNMRQAAGLVAYKADAAGHLLSDEFPRQIGRADLFQLSDRFGCRGEFSIVFKTAVVRQYRFPVFGGEKYLGESVLYDRMSGKSEFVLCPHVLTVCEYQKNGLSSMHLRLMKENPAGFCLYFMQRIDLERTWPRRWITAGKYHAFGRFAGEKRTPYHGAHPWLVRFAIPWGAVFAWYYRAFRGF